MSFCPFCGRQVEDGQTCECQSKQTPAISTQPTTNTEYQTSNGKLFSALAYVGFLWIIGLLVDPEKSDPKVKFHVGQGLLLFIANAALTIVSRLLGIFMPDFIMTFLNMVIAVFVIVFTIIGIVNAIHGEEKELPVIGQFAFYK